MKPSSIKRSRRCLSRRVDSRDSSHEKDLMDLFFEFCAKCPDRFWKFWVGDWETRDPHSILIYCPFLLCFVFSYHSIILFLSPSGCFHHLSFSRTAEWMFIFFFLLHSLDKSSLTFLLSQCWTSRSLKTCWKKVSFPRIHTYTIYFCCCVVFPCFGTLIMSFLEYFFFTSSTFCSRVSFCWGRTQLVG